jgi:hypothetical protein
LVITDDIASTDIFATADDVISTGDVLATAGIVSMDATAVKRGESTSFRSGIEAGLESGSITQPLSLGVGKRFDSESASATAKTRTPPSVPPTKIAESGIRPAEVAA